MWALGIIMSLFEMFGPGMQGLVQYPDKQLYHAAKLLKPEDRPSVPVEPVENDPEKYQILRVRPETNAWYDPVGKRIKIVKGRPKYQAGGKGLAAVLAHEGEHARATDPFDELKPYQRQLQVLRDMGQEVEAQVIEGMLRRRGNQK